MDETTLQIFDFFFTTNEKEYVLVRNWWHVVMITA